MIAVELQPDQRPALLDDHIALYEEVFEPLTLAFAVTAIDHLEPAALGALGECREEVMTKVVERLEAVQAVGASHLRRPRSWGAERRRRSHET
jgi:hypothetical protein